MRPAVAPAGKVVGYEHFSLPHAEHDLDLVEPGGAHRQPMDADFEAQPERTNPLTPRCLATLVSRCRVDLYCPLQTEPGIRPRGPLGSSQIICSRERPDHVLPTLLLPHRLGER